MMGQQLIVLCADDYALTDGVSAAILSLARAGRLSATSAMTVSHHWPAHAAALKPLRDRLSIGLHVTLTGGLAPLGPMPSLAPRGRLPRIGALTTTALGGTLCRPAASAEIEAEIGRQIEAFTRSLGFPPDHIDGHQHAHALAGVRAALLRAVARHGIAKTTLIRDPADRLVSILRRRRETAKALILTALSAGFAGKVQSAGYRTNDGFAGVSDFVATKVEVAADFARACLAPGRLHLVMCHPGHVDAELGRLDPVTNRRQLEFDALMAGSPITDSLWRPARGADGPPVDWAKVVKS